MRHVSFYANSLQNSKETTNWTRTPRTCIICTYVIIFSLKRAVGDVSTPMGKLEQKTRGGQKYAKFNFGGVGSNPTSVTSVIAYNVPAFNYVIQKIY